MWWQRGARRRGARFVGDDNVELLGHALETSVIPYVSPTSNKNQKAGFLTFCLFPCSGLEDAGSQGVGRVL